MRAGWVNDPQVALTTLQGHSHTVLKPATPLQLVRTEEASWMRNETSSRH